MKIKSDERLNSQLQNEVSELRESIIKNVKNTSERFVAVSSTDAPEMIITDTTTWRTTTVPLYGYGNVMKALSELFE